MFAKNKYRLIDVYTKRNTLPKFDELINKLQWLSKEELLYIETVKLKNLINFVYHKNPYYSELFDILNLKPSDIKSRNDLYKLPIINKKIIKDNYEKIKSEGFNKFRPRVRATSGSTGESFHFIIDSKTHSWIHAYMLLAWHIAGYRLGDKFISITSGQNKTKTVIKEKVFSYLRNSIDLSSFNINDQIMLDYIDIINSKKSQFIYGYSSAMAYMSKYILDNKIAVHSPKGIVTTAENLLPHNRERIELAFKSKVYDQYGVMESGVTAFECENHKGYHIGMTKGIVEIIDDDGKVVLDMPGNIVSTDLDNYAFPMIRYDSGDVGVKSSSQCTCGRGFEMLSELQGRTREFLTTKNGKKIHGAIFSYIVRENPWINQYQIYQKVAGEILIKIVTDAQIDNYKEMQIKNYFKNSCPDPLDVKIQKVQDIEMGENLKRHFVISEISNI